MSPISLTLLANNLSFNLFNLDFSSVKIEKSRSAAISGSLLPPQISNETINGQEFSDASSGRFPAAELRAKSGLSIVIVTYNSASVLPGLLDSLPAGLEGIKQFQTIVVDNNSADNSVDTHSLTQPGRESSEGPKCRICCGDQCRRGHCRPECGSADSQPRHPSAPRRGAFADRSFDGSVRRCRGAANPGRGRNYPLVAAPGTLRHDGMDGRHSRGNVGWAYRQRAR